MAGFLSTKHGNVSGAYDSSKVGFLSSNGASCQPTKTRNWLVDRLEPSLLRIVEGCTNLENGYAQLRIQHKWAMRA